MKSLFMIMLIYFSITKNDAFRKDLLPIVTNKVSNSQIENWTMELIAVRVGEKQFTWIIFVNMYIKINIPIVVFDGKSATHLPESCADAPLIVLIKFDTIPSLKDIFQQLSSYRSYFNAGKFVIILPGPPSKTICKFFKQAQILYVVFVEIFQNGHLGIHSGECYRMQPNFLMSLNSYLFASTNSIRVCYYENSPYTILPSTGKGIEQHVIDLVGQYLKMSIEYIKCNVSDLCTQGAQNSQIWTMLYNHSCDAVMGIRPCQHFYRDFDVSSTYFLDAAILIAPKKQCLRRVGFLKISLVLKVLFSCTNFLLGYVVRCLSKYRPNNMRYKHSTINLAWAAKFALTSISVLAAIAFNGFLQGKIFETLIASREDCGAKSLEELMVLKEKISFEWPIFLEFVEKLTFDRNLKVAWQPNRDEKSLNPKKNHIVRLLAYKYNLPKMYVADNGEAIFREVETLSLIHIGVFFYKKHSLVANVSEALLVVLQSGINGKFVEMLLADGKRIEVIDQETKFSNVHLQEIEWLFSWHFLGLVMSSLVFTGEIIFSYIFFQYY